MTKTYILTHGNCYDGHGAAYAAWQKFGDSAIYLECHYGKPLPKVEDGSDVFMIDFSSDRETIEALAKRVNLTILDHHISAQKNLEGLPYAHFDMTKSGAVLAWEYFFPNEKLPALFAYVQDQDLWQHKLPDSKEVHACLASYPKTFKSWRAFENKPYDDVLKEGMALLRYKNETVKMMCDKSTLEEVDGYKVAIVNATSHWSDIGAELLQRYPEVDYVASYYIEGNQKKWSLRSRPDFDVSQIAKARGGGGHACASGYVENLD